MLQDARDSEALHHAALCAGPHSAHTVLTPDAQQPCQLSAFVPVWHFLEGHPSVRQAFELQGFRTTVGPIADERENSWRPPSQPPPLLCQAKRAQPGLGCVFESG